jgi:23S rRNA (uracil1939-C5)-methyltransferase
MVLLQCCLKDEADRPRMKEVLQFVADRFPQITSLLYVVNNKCNDTIGDLQVEVFRGNDHIFEEMEGLRFKIGPKSFYQTNSEQAYVLYKVAREFAGLTGDELVYDLYTGTGTIANFVSRQARKVIGIEYVPEAIEDAKVNSQINGIANTLFYAGDMKDILTQDFINEHGRPDVIITDPPRAGMHTDVINTILFAEPRRIVYVSCNPATQARDLQLLDVKYRVVKVQPVDMFPHTHHVENVVLLERREESLESRE